MVSHAHDGNVKSSSTKVEDQDISLSIFSVGIGNGRSCRLIDNTQDIKSCNTTSILSCRTLIWRKVGRHCDNSILNTICLPHLLTNYISTLAKFIQNQGRKNNGIDTCVVWCITSNRTTNITFEVKFKVFCTSDFCPTFNGFLTKRHMVLATNIWEINRWT